MLKIFDKFKELQDDLKNMIGFWMTLKIHTLLVIKKKITWKKDQFKNFFIINS